MEKIYFKNDMQGGTPVPKVIWWYLCEIKYKGAITARKCNDLLNNELKGFFEKYPEELHKGVCCDFFYKGATNITQEEINFYRKEIMGGTNGRAKDMS